MSKQTILRLPCVIQRTGLSRSTIYAYIKDELFPQPIYLGARSVGWIEAEIDEWIAGQIQKARPAHVKGGQND